MTQRDPTRLVSHHDVGYRRYDYSERCPCGERIDTDNPRVFSKWRIAHAHHRT